MTVSTVKLWPLLDRGEILGNGGQEAETGSPIASRDAPMNGHARGPKSVIFFGHFDGTNFGNECSLQTILYHLRRLRPEAHVICVCSGPQTIASTHHIRALSFNGVFRKPRVPGSRLTRTTRKIYAALRLPFQLVECMRSFCHADMFVIPGTGLLTDAYGLRGWGPGGLLKWSLIAKACGCKVALVSVGAGPIHSAIGRWCTRLTLSLAEFRSYRDIATVRYLQQIGCVGDDEAVFPDLAFSLPECMIPRRNRTVAARPVVGLGVMEYPGKYGAHGLTEGAFPEYLQVLVESTRRLLHRGYDIRLLSGDLADSDARRTFRRVLQEKLPAYDCDRILDEPVASVMDVLSQIALTDFVVATRFHNILFAFLCEKPVISISFHLKCRSLMALMGMSDYCLEMGGLKADELIDTFDRLEANAHTLGASITQRITSFRQALDEQYDMLFGTARQDPQAAELITN